MSNKLPTARELIAKIVPNQANFEHCGRYRTINGSLLIDIEKAIESHTAAHTAALQERVKELESVAQQFIEAVDREEIIIQENFDNDGWENCGGRLYESFKNALKK